MKTEPCSSPRIPARPVSGFPRWCLAFCFLALLALALQTQAQAAAPTLSNAFSLTVSATGATLGGNVTSDGGSAVTERGVVYAVTTANNNPLIGGSSVTKLSTTGTTGFFNVNLTGLAPSKGYSYKAYATNSVGTTYSNVATITTLALPAGAPTISDVPNLFIAEDFDTGYFPVTVGDSNTAAASLTMSGSSDNTTLVPNGNIVFGGSGTARTVTVTPAANQNGTAMITLSVSDGTTTTSDTFVLTVNAVNDAPSFTIVPDEPVGATWIERMTDSNRNWHSITSSADGSKLAAVVIGGIIYTSTNSGMSWTERMTDMNRNWYSIASSADGSKLAAVVAGGKIYTSTNSGMSWTERMTDMNRSWYSIASSADGSKLAAAVYGGHIYTSTDSGLTWTARMTDTDRYWHSITSSANGSKLAAVEDGGQIYTSNNSGLNWTARETSRRWRGITTSADGNKLAAAFEGFSHSNIYTSTDSGANWTARFPGDGNTTYRGITSSADGNKLAVAVVNVFWDILNSPILTSTNSGMSWTERMTDMNRSWSSITSSADGNKLAAVVKGGKIYTSTSFYNLNVVATSGPSTTPAVVSGIISGPPDESSQAVVFTASNNNNPLFAVQPTIAADGTLTFSPGGNAGVATVSVFAVDTGGTAIGGIHTSAVQTFTITVLPATAPTITPVADQTINEDSSTAALAFKVDDAETPLGNLNMSARSSNTTLVPDANIVFGGSGANRTVTVTPAPNQHGSTTIDIMVDDGALSAVETFVLTVNAVNDAPSFALPGGAVWTPRDSDRNWQSIASSADGTKLAAVVNNGYLYTSTDSGATWVQRNSIRYWLSVASSADGNKLAACVSNGQIFTSIDAGATWTTRATNRDWRSIASSADGTRLAAVVFGGQIYTSSDSGATWDAQGVSLNWRSITSSANGSKLAALVQYGRVHTSSDFGVTWTERLASPSGKDWWSITSSADGTRIAAVAVNDRIYTSSDSGATWIAQMTDASRNWRGITMSADGTKLAAVVQNGQIHTSIDSGGTWAAREINRPWYAITSSADGSKLAAAASIGQIYTSNSSSFSITVPGGSGPYTFPAFATSISPGPPNETSQTVVGFTVTNLNNSRFVVQPAIVIDAANSANGTLTFTPGIIASNNQIFVSAADNGGTANGGVNTSAVQIFNINITNDGPTNITLSASSMAENNAPNATVGTLASTDPNPGNNFTYSFASGGGDNASFTLAGNALKLTPSADFETKSSYAVRIRSTDQGGLFFEKDFAITIVNVNEMPSFTKGADKTHVAGTTAAQSFSAWATAINDGDSTVTQALTFNLIVSGDAIFTTPPAVNSAGTLSYGLNGTNGTATINISLMDDATAGGAALATSVQTFTITVSPNAAPTISDVADLSINEDTATSALAFTVGDAETAPASLTVSGFSSDTTLVPDANIVFAGSGANRTVTVTPVANLSGTVSIALLVNDGSLPAVVTFLLTVNSVNDAPSFAFRWAPRESNRFWRGIASSADGMKLAAVEKNGPIYTSTDAGVSWTAGGPPLFWYAITSSADGSKLAALDESGFIYTSIDSGLNWQPRMTDADRSWQAIASSDDGTKLAAVVYNRHIYTSIDSGANWTERMMDANRTWYSITSSADGSKLAAVVLGGKIYTSSDSGANWFPQDSNRNWVAITSSADGSKLAAVVQGGKIYTSTNSGGTWFPQESIRSWNAITSSADGSKLAASVYNGLIYTSTDYGVTWFPKESNRPWRGIASSADGSKIAAATFGGQIYTSIGTDYNLTVAASSGTYTAAPFASGISPGPANESAQTTLFIVTNDNSGLFSAPPAIDSSGTLTFTPGSTAGTATVTVTAMDSGGTANGGVDTSAPQTFTITIIPDALAGWRTFHFPGGGGNSGNLADPDFDGTPNLVEYAFALDPNIADSGQLPTPVLSGGNMCITFTQPPGVTGITYGAEWSSDMVLWYPVADTGSGNTHLFCVPMGNYTNLYMRHRITQP